MSKLKLIITGWSRGGLGYVAELLRLSGADVGQTFDENICYKNVEEWLQNAKEIEVSSFFVPWLSYEKLKGIRVVFITRDPMCVLNSLYFHGMFHDEKMSKIKEKAYYVLHNFKENYEGKPAQAAVAYIVEWYGLAKFLCPTLTELPVEEGPHYLLKILLSQQFKSNIFCPPEVNSSNCRQVLVPSKLPKKAKKAMLALLTNLGYYIRFWLPRGGHAHYANADWHC